MNCRAIGNLIELFFFWFSALSLDYACIDTKTHTQNLAYKLNMSKHFKALHYVCTCKKKTKIKFIDFFVLIGLNKQ